MSIELNEVTSDAVMAVRIDAASFIVQGEVMRLPAFGAIESSVVDEVVDDVQGDWDWSYSAADDRNNPDWERIARQSAKSAVQKVLGVLLVVEKSQTSDQ